jgi:hypothetical protein
MSDIPFSSAAVLGPVSRSATLFALPEYDVAVRRFVHVAFQQLLVDKDPILKSIRTVEAPVRSSRNTISDEEVLENRPITFGVPIRIDRTAIVNGHLESLTCALDDASSEALPNVMKQLFDQMHRTADAAGTRVDAGGAPFTWDLFLDALGKISIDFDGNGAPVLPTLIAHPDLVKRVPPMTELQRARMAEIIEEKRGRHDAGRRTRRLS